MFRMFRKSLAIAVATATLAFNSPQAHATIVLVETNMGNFEINLFDQTTPETVANFLAYVKDGSYNNSLFSRAVKNFVVQAAGVRYSGNNTSPFTVIPRRGPVDNEPKLSNVRGTVAMAKLEDSAHSATMEWFINVQNNASNLDRQNSGYTVFGVITGSGMSVVDSMNELYLPGGTGPFAVTPLRNYSATDMANKVPVTAANLVTIERITVINDSPTTAANLNPALNTLAGKDNAGSGSGSSAPAFLLALTALVGWCRRQRKTQMSHQ